MLSKRLERRRRKKFTQNLKLSKRNVARYVIMYVQKVKINLEYLGVDRTEKIVDNYNITKRILRISEVSVIRNISDR